MLVLSVGLLSISVMQVSAIKGNSHASHLTVATALISKKLEEYKSFDYAQIQDEQGNEDIYQWVTTVQPDDPATNLKTVTVNVTWTTGNISHSFSFGTIIGRQ